MTDEQRVALVDALRQAQDEFPEIHKSRKGHRGSYAPLPDVIEATRPALSKHGLVVSQTTDMMMPAPGGEGRPVLVLRTTLSHVGGGSIEGVYPLGSPADYQDAGKGITYMRRYTLQGILGIAADDADADDDASTPRSGGARRHQQQQQQQRREPKGDFDPGHIKQFADRLAKAGIEPAATKAAIVKLFGEQSMMDVKAASVRDAARRLGVSELDRVWDTAAACVEAHVRKPNGRQEAEPERKPEHEGLVEAKTVNLGDDGGWGVQLPQGVKGEPGMVVVKTTKGGKAWRVALDEFHAETKWGEQWTDREPTASEKEAVGGGQQADDGPADDGDVPF